MSSMEKLRRRWGVDSTRRVILILIVFSLAGCSILFVKDPVYRVLGVAQDASLGIKILVAICIYQVLLLFWGTALGEFRFFWEKEKKLIRWIFKWFRPRTYLRASRQSPSPGDPS